MLIKVTRYVELTSVEMQTAYVEVDPSLDHDQIEAELLASHDSLDYDTTTLDPVEPYVQELMWERAEQQLQLDLSYTLQ